MAPRRAAVVWSLVAWVVKAVDRVVGWATAYREMPLRQELEQSRVGLGTLDVSVAVDQRLVDWVAQVAVKVVR